MGKKTILFRMIFLLLSFFSPCVLNASPTLETLSSPSKTSSIPHRQNGEEVYVPKEDTAPQNPTNNPATLFAPQEKISKKLIEHSETEKHHQRKANGGGLTWFIVVFMLLTVVLFVFT